MPPTPPVPTAFAPAEGRTLLALGLPPDGVARFRERAAALGFVIRHDDPRRSVVACAGAPACASGLMPARAIAARDRHRRGADPRRLGHPPHLGLRQGLRPSAARRRWPSSAASSGAGLVVAGRAGDDAIAIVPPGDLPAARRRLAAAVSASAPLRRDAPPTPSPASARTGSPQPSPASRPMRDTFRLYPRRRGDLCALLRHHPERGRPRPLHARTRPRSRSA